MYSEQERFEETESAYRQSLAIKTQQGNHAGEASSLNQLANLYNAWKRPEQAVDYHRQAADCFAQLGDKRYARIPRVTLRSTQATP